ncbi:MAG: hypothetical protein KAU28_08375, partial [Phycisphaerae bacterium]|nr:hypothetical protein [Phycisphaerae bacterium]
MAFRFFRLLVGATIGAVAAWLIGEGVHQLFAPSAEALTASDLVAPVMRIIAGLVVAGLYYWAMWADSRIHRVLENIFSIPELLRKLAFT